MQFTNVENVDEVRTFSEVSLGLISVEKNWSELSEEVKTQLAAELNETRRSPFLVSDLMINCQTVG